MMQFKTVEEDAIVSMMHAEMLFIRGMCGPQTWKPSDTECRMEMVKSLVEAGKVMRGLVSRLYIDPTAPRLSSDDMRRNLVSSIVMQLPGCGRTPSTLEFADFAKWHDYLTGNVMVLDRLTGIYTSGSESFKALFAISTLHAFRQMLDLSYAFLNDLGLSSGDGNGNYWTPGLFKEYAEPFVRSWTNWAPRVHVRAIPAIVGIFDISLHRLNAILPMVDLCPTHERKK